MWVRPSRLDRIEGSPQIGPANLERRWHHTDYGIGNLINEDELAKDRRITGKLMLPERISEHCDSVMAWRVFVRQKGAPENWSDAQHRKIVGGDLFFPHSHGRTICRSRSGS